MKMKLEAGSKVQDYVLVERLGSGAFGEVWKAVHGVLGRVVAIKFATSDAAAPTLTRAIVSQFGLEHRGIVKVLDASLDHEPPFVLFEHVEGGTLRAVLRERGRLEIADAVSIFRKLCDALAYSHTRGIVHGDLKPENIIITPEGDPRVTDFVGVTQEEAAGLAGAADAGVRASLATLGAIGTYHYLAPEQERGEGVDGRADIYALGVVLFEMLTGSLPQGRDLPSEVNPYVSWWWDHIFSRCYTGKDRRYRDMTELAADLDCALTGPGYGEMPSQKRRAESGALRTKAGWVARSGEAESSPGPDRERDREPLETRAMRRLAERIALCHGTKVAADLPRGGIISKRSLPLARTADPGSSPPPRARPARAGLAVAISFALAVGLPAVVLGSLIEREPAFGGGLDLSSLTAPSASTCRSRDDGRPAIGARPSAPRSRTAVAVRNGAADKEVCELVELYANLHAALAHPTGPNERRRLVEERHKVRQALETLGFRPVVVEERGGGWRVDARPEWEGLREVRGRSRTDRERAHPAEY